MEIKALIFDLDDTLYPEREYVDSGFEAVDHFLSQRLNIENFYDEATRLFKKGERGNIFDESLKNLDVSPTPELIKQLVEIYRCHHPNIQLFWDAEWILFKSKLKVQKGLITDGNKFSQRNKIKALGIHDVLNPIIVCDEIGRNHWKPSQTPFKIVECKLAIEGETCLYVGDNPQKDFIGAKKRGWKTARIHRASGLYGNSTKLATSCEADIIVESLLEIPKVIESFS